MRVLLCTDGSAHASAATELLLRLGLPADTETMVVAVVEASEPFSLSAAIAESEREVLSGIESSMSERARGWADAEADRCLAAGWSVRVSTPKGVASDAILEAIDEFEADLVVLGARHSEEAGRNALGRTARRVVKFARCAVLVARRAAGGGGDASSADEGLQILVAYDSSPAARAALAALAGFSLGEGAEVTVLTVLTVSTTLYGHDILQRMSETWQAHKRSALAELEGIEAQLSATLPKVSSRLLDGGTNATDEILDAATVVGADLVMVGRTGKNGLERFLLGSVSGEVVEAASCSVWVAPSDEAE